MQIDEEGFEKALERAFLAGYWLHLSSDYNDLASRKNRFRELLKDFKKPFSETIKDSDCREYKQGWNSCNSGRNYLSNPYGVAFDGELYRLWQKGFNDCQFLWDNASIDVPTFSEIDLLQSFSIIDEKA